MMIWISKNIRFKQFKNIDYFIIIMSGNNKKPFQKRSFSRVAERGSERGSERNSRKPVTENFKKACDVFFKEHCEWEQKDIDHINTANEYELSYRGETYTLIMDDKEVDYLTPEDKSKLEKDDEGNLIYEKVTRKDLIESSYFKGMVKGYNKRKFPKMDFAIFADKKNGKKHYFKLRPSNF